MKCVNKNCKKDPDKSIDSVVVNCDGDLACDENCKKEYEKQRDTFFNNIGDDKFFLDWISDEFYEN
jgi:hypothetical protein